MISLPFIAPDRSIIIHFYPFSSYIWAVFVCSGGTFSSQAQAEMKPLLGMSWLVWIPAADICLCFYLYLQSTFYIVSICCFVAFFSLATINWKPTFELSVGQMICLLMSCWALGYTIKNSICPILWLWPNTCSTNDIPSSLCCTLCLVLIPVTPLTFRVDLFDVLVGVWPLGSSYVFLCKIYLLKWKIERRIFAIQYVNTAI